MCLTSKLVIQLSPAQQAKKAKAYKAYQLLDKKFNKEAKAKFRKELISTAKKDIKVWKILKCYDGIYRSPFRGFKYEPDVLYKAILKPDIEFSRAIFHAGLHSYRTCSKATYKRGSGAVIIEMIIPKGSKYVIGTNGNIVSNRLIWKTK